MQLSFNIVFKVTNYHNFKANALVITGTLVYYGVVTSQFLLCMNSAMAWHNRICTEISSVK